MNHQQTQTKSNKIGILIFTLLLFISTAIFSAPATNVTIRVDNLAEAGGLFFTPVWVGLHDGTFDVFDSGAVASSELEALAEGGDTSGLSTLFTGCGVDGVVATGTPFGPAGSAFGSTAELTLTVDSMVDRYFSFASMIIPSNDAFIGNADAMQYEIFDASGVFTGPHVITLYGRHIWDAGTEVNNANGGAAFSNLGGISVDENGVIHQHTGLNDFLGFGFAPPPVAGELLTTAFGADTPIAQITIIPEPTTLALLGLGGLLLRRRHN